MKVFTCFLLLRILAYTSIEAQSPPTESHRSVNLALETVLEFNNKDHSADVKFLDNVQHFISKVKTVIDKNKNSRRSFRATRVDTLTDFFVEVVNLVNTFEDTDFQDFYEILDEEIRKYHYRGCKFYELTENIELRKLLADKLNLIRGKTVFAVKSYVNSLTETIRSRNYDKYIQDLVDYINALYRQDVREKFKEILGDLEFYSNTNSKKSNANLVKIIRNAIRTIIFDHYTKLTPNARRALRSKIDTFWKLYKQNSTTSPKADNVENDSYGKLDIPELSTPEPTDYGYKESPTNHKNEKDDKNENRIEIKNTDYKKKSIMRDGVKQKKVTTVKYTKIDTGYEQDEKDDEVFKVTSRKASFIEHTSKRNSEIFSAQSGSEYRDLSGETLERNSIELYQKHQEEINTQRYMTLFPEELSYEMTTTTEKPEKVIHRSAKISTKSPVLQTMWIEEATGRIPKAIIEQYNQMNKKRHETHKSKPLYREEYSRESNHWPKKTSKHKLRQGTSHIKRQGYKLEVNQKRKQKPKHKMTKHSHSKHKPVVSKLLPKHKKAEIFSREHNFIDVATAMEFYEYKKMLGPAHLETHNESSTTSKVHISMRPASRVVKTRRSTVPSRATQTRRSMGPSRFSVASRFSVPPRQSTPSRLVILNHPIPHSSLAKSPTNRFVTAPLEQYSKRFEMLTGKQHRAFRKNAPVSPYEYPNLDRRRKTARRQSSSNVTDKFDINVEQNVMKRINDLEKELNRVKSKIDDIKTEETKLKKAVDTHVKNDKLEKHKNVEIPLRIGTNPGRTFRLLGSPNNEIDYKTEIKVFKDKDKPVEETKIKATVAETKTTKVTKQLEIDQKVETITDEGLNQLKEVSKDTRTDNKVKLMIGNHGKFGFEDWKSDGQIARSINNYDDEEDDVWKDSFKFYMKPSTRSTSTKATTRSGNTTTIKSTKSDSFSPLVELFITIPSSALSTKKTATSEKDNTVSTIDVENKNKTTKNIPELVTEPIKNVTNEVLIKETTQKSNFTMLTLSSIHEENDTKILSAEKLKKRKEVLHYSLPVWSSNTSSTVNIYHI